MSDIVVTGGNGFLGWHTRVAGIETGLSSKVLPVGEAYDAEKAKIAVSGASRVLHLAGVNRGSDKDIREGNRRFAQQLAAAVLEAEERPQFITYANSTQSTNGSVYGDAKAEASDILRAAADKIGATYQDVRLPNLFGEHGRPFYNAVTATFSHLLARGDRPSIENDKELTLLHAQDAADILLGNAIPSELSELEVTESVSGLLDRLTLMASTYARGEIPDVASKFNRDLFNTYRSYTFPEQAPVRLTRREDARGSFFEVVRSHGGSGQASFSTTRPGISRGDHFHRRKIERFTVLSGSATISMRRLLTGDTIEFKVTGDAPVAVDMPTMWSHKITNSGEDLLYTSFWSNDIFDPDAPDTIAEAV